MIPGLQVLIGFTILTLMCSITIITVIAAYLEQVKQFFPPDFVYDMKKDIKSITRLGIGIVIGSILGQLFIDLLQLQPSDSPWLFDPTLVIPVCGALLGMIGGSHSAKKQYKDD